MKDSYELFLAHCHITKEQFFQFGIEETIYAPLEAAEARWEELKSDINNNQTVYIRDFGRNGVGTQLFMDFYKGVLGKDNIVVDPTNNANPQKVIAKLTNHTKGRSIRNYQTSHVFGRTKNIYAFTAPWNIVLIPKIIDPLTGHEAKGPLIEEYQKLFRQKSFERFQPMIEEFNTIITAPVFCESIRRYIEKISADGIWEKKDILKLQKALLEQFSPIVPTTIITDSYA